MDHKTFAKKVKQQERDDTMRLIGSENNKCTSEVVNHALLTYDKHKKKIYEK